MLSLSPVRGSEVSLNAAGALTSTNAVCEQGGSELPPRRCLPTRGERVGPASQSNFLVLTMESSLDRLFQTLRLDPECRYCRWVAHQSCIAHAVDKLVAYSNGAARLHCRPRSEVP